MNRTLTIFNILKGIDLKGGYVYTYSRKPNSTTLDVVVTDTSINIHALNTKDSTQPNLPDFKYVLDKIHERIGFLDDGEIKKGADSYWFLSISLENINDVIPEVTMHENTSLTDGYGGSIVTDKQVWIGNVGIEEKSTIDSLKGGKYNITTIAELLVPKDLYVKKNNYFLVNGIKYVVNGIVENKIYVARGRN